MHFTSSPGFRQQALFAHFADPLTVARLLLGLGIALQAACAVAAPSFEERLQRARTTEALPALRPYFQAMGKMIEPNLRSGVATCLAKFKDPDMNGFIVVADVNKNGEPTNVDSQPHSNVSDCFARSFEFARLPKLAPYTKEASLPIFFQIDLK